MNTGKILGTGLIIVIAITLAAVFLIIMEGYCPMSTYGGRGCDRSLCYTQPVGGCDKTGLCRDGAVCLPKYRKTLGTYLAKLRTLFK